VDAFNAALMAFSARQVDCDVVDAKAVLEGRVGDGQLTIGPESFGCVVLPAVRTIDPQALHQLMEFVSSGGTLLVIDAWPTRAYPQGQMPDLQAWLGGPLPQKGQVATVGRGRVIFVADAADLASELPEQVRPNIRFLSGQNGCAYAAVRREAARTAWLVVNDGAQPLELDIELPAHLLPAVDGGLTWVDPVSGLCGRQPCEAGSSGLRTRLMLEDTQAMILVAGGASVPEAAPAVAPVSRSARTIELDQWTFQLAPTSLEERWTDKLNPELVSLPVWKAIGRGWRRMAGWTQRDFDDSEFRRVSTPRGGALLEDEVALLRSVLPPGARAIQLPLPTDGEFMIHVNGQLLGKFLGPPPKGSLDIHKHVSGIGDVVAIEVSSMAGPSGLVDAPRILCGPVKLPQLTAWGNMGLWWYSGRAVYRTSFTLAKAPSVARLDLGDVRHYVEVWVNGRRADELLWPPYRLNVAGLLRRGTNRLSLVVSNSLASRFLWDSWGTRCGQGWGIGPKEEPSGLLGPVRLAAE
jgi:hypothetical protein